jgi:CheY-like chemotaxis protein
VKKVASLPDDSRQSTRPRKGLRDTILYVEDDDENWDVAEGSREACDLLRERHDIIDVVLMDIELRGSELNGIELTELFRGKKLTRSLPHYADSLPLVSKPIIFVTAHGARYSDVELMLFGADKVISKPVNFNQLNLALASISVSNAARRR